jgi:hypothetical protein
VPQGLRLFILLTSIGLLGRGATLERLSLDDMIEKSTAIVRGRVTGSYSALHGSIIYTHFTVQVQERWKGAETQQMDVVVPGGTSGVYRQTFTGTPKLTGGGEYVLFLWKGASGLTNIIGLSQGVFDLKRDGKAGEALAVRPAAAEVMLDSSGRAVKDEPVQMRLHALRERITTTLARGGGK